MTAGTLKKLSMSAFLQISGQKAFYLLIFGLKMNFGPKTLYIQIFGVKPTLIEDYPIPFNPTDRKYVLLREKLFYHYKICSIIRKSVRLIENLFH